MTNTGTLLDDLRANAATLADFDNAPDHYEVDHHGVAALLTRAAKAIEDAEAAREAMRRERNAAMNERDAAYAALRARAPLCSWCSVEIATRRSESGPRGLRCDACPVGDFAMEIPHAAALRAAAKAGE